MYKLNIIDKISLGLVIIGAINWGLIGLFNFNFVAILLGEPANIIARIVYILVGIAGIDMIFLFIKTRRS